MEPRFVHVDLPMHQSFGQDVALGVNRYALTSQRAWHLTVPDWGEPLATTPGMAGIITRCSNEAEEAALRAGDVPAVNVSGMLRDVTLPRVHTDDRRCGIIAAEHLLSLGFKHFAAPFPRGQVWRDRVAGFARTVRRAGHRCRCLDLQDITLAQHQTITQRLAEWLKTLPPMTGLLGVTDLLGRRLSDASRLAGLAIPHQFALVCIDNSELICHLAEPPLTTVDINAERIGFEAARVLDGLMNGRAPKEQSVRIPPRGLVIRRSTDTLAMEDELVVEAMQLIRAHACDPLSVTGLLARLAVSRRSLETRMRAAVGRSPGEEIRRVRFQTAMDLLTWSDLPLNEVAHRVGYGDLAAFTNAFKPHTGQSPGHFRKLNRRGGSDRL